MYERHIKAIYSAIVAFISNTAFSRKDEESTQLQWLREANTYLVKAVKDAGQLQENLIRYTGSDNQSMSDVYNQLRIQIAMTIRELEQARTSGSGVLDVLELDALKLQLEEERNRLNQSMSELISKHAITPAMGSSLVNDSIFAHDIAFDLIRAAQVLFATTDKNLVEAARDVMLDASDINLINEQAGANDPVDPLLETVR